MNTEKTKNILYLILSLFILVLSYGVVSYVNTYSKSIQPDAYRRFSVLAEGKVVAKPDIAEFNFSIISEGKNLSQIQKENTEKANNAINFLKQNGIEEKDIKTTNYNITPKYTYYNCGIEPMSYPVQGNSLRSEPKPCPPPQITGYTITQTIKVKMRDFSKIGNILSGIVEYGANNVSALSFTIDDLTKLENEAREQAIQKAKEKAQNIAKSGGFKLGNILSIDEGYLPYLYSANKSLGVGGGMPEATSLAPQIEPGSTEVKVTVTLTYEIK